MVIFCSIKRKNLLFRDPECNSKQQSLVLSYAIMCVNDQYSNLNFKLYSLWSLGWQRNGSQHKLTSQLFTLLFQLLISHWTSHFLLSPESASTILTQDSSSSMQCQCTVTSKTEKWKGSKFSAFFHWKIVKHGKECLHISYHLRKGIPFYPFYLTTWEKLQVPLKNAIYSSKSELPVLQVKKQTLHNSIEEPRRITSVFRSWMKMLAFSRWGKEVRNYHCTDEEIMQCTKDPGNFLHNLTRNIVTQTSDVGRFSTLFEKQVTQIQISHRKESNAFKSTMSSSFFSGYSQQNFERSYVLL